MLLDVLLLSSAAQPVVLVTGAAGRTGSLVYTQLVASGDSTVRALVHGNVSTARTALGCDACDSSEGLFYGDVTNASSLTAAFSGVDMVAIAIGLSGSVPATVMQAVEWKGVEAQVEALVTGTVGAYPALRKVVLCSSMGTTNANPPPFEGGKDLFWKLQAEAFLATSGVPSTVIKPGGLTDGPGNAALLVGHDDALLAKGHFEVDRADVARVMVAALFHKSAGLRVDLAASKTGTPTTDLSALLDSAVWPWQR